LMKNSTIRWQSLIVQGYEKIVASKSKDMKLTRL
jgi:hypothetical protein